MDLDLDCLFSVFVRRFALAVRHSPSLFKVPELPRSHPRAREGSAGSDTESSKHGQGSAAQQQGAKGKAEPEDEDTEFLGQGLAALGMVSAWGRPCGTDHSSSARMQYCAVVRLYLCFADE